MKRDLEAEDRLGGVRLRRDRGFEPAPAQPDRTVRLGELAFVAVVVIILVSLIVSMVRVRVERDRAMKACQADGHKAYECAALLSREGQPGYIAGVPGSN